MSKKIKKMTKHSDAQVAATAEAICDGWRACIKAKPASAPPAAVATAPLPVKSEAPVQPVEAMQQEVKPKVEPKTEVKAEASSSSSRPRPVIAKTGDQVRDSVRDKLQEVFEKGVADNESVLREMDAYPPLMAQEAEEAMYDRFNGTSKDYKARFRSLMFNLRDAKNPEFLRQIVTGQRHVNDLADMEVRDMASDEVQKQREKWKEHAKMALMDEKSYKQYSGIKTEDGILKCPKCKSMKTEYVEVQTRSADEPTTKKCMCNNCDCRWKFC